MRRTLVLLRQHIGWHFSKHWVFQGKRKPLETGAEKVLREKNIPVFEPNDILKEKRVFERVEVIGYRDKPIKLDKTHPDWHDRPLLSYKDNNVLLEGLTQAKILTNTVEIKDGLPESVALNDLTEDINSRVKRIILGSHVFDAEQQKLPKIKDPERPAWNFPRTYGITQNRVNKLMTSRLLNLIETTCNNEDIVNERYIFNNLIFSYPFEKYQDLIQFQLTGDTVIMSSRPLTPITLESTNNFELPDIAPIKSTITLNKENIYKVQNVYPVKASHTNKICPHTVFVFYDKEEVKNVFEEEVTETQIFGRSLLKSFTVSASFAKQTYGNDVKQLPKPVTVQCVQTNGHFYHFGMFQLNSLDLEGDLKNVWYQTPLLHLFSSCGYNVGKPVLEGYNSEVIKHLYAFYNNV